MTNHHSMRQKSVFIIYIPLFTLYLFMGRNCPKSSLKPKKTQDNFCPALLNFLCGRGWRSICSPLELPSLTVYKSEKVSNRIRLYRRRDSFFYPYRQGHLCMEALFIGVEIDYAVITLNSFQDGGNAKTEATSLRG